MWDSGQKSPDANWDLEKSELQRILASSMFSRSRRLVNLLIYLCNSHFQGATRQITPQKIAQELYAKPADFDTNRDPIVRVEVTRLRAKLRRYYLTEGKENPVRISIQMRTYAPAFTCAFHSPSSVRAVAEPCPEETLSREAVDQEHVPVSFQAASAFPSRLVYPVVYAIVAVTFAVIGISVFHASPRSSSASGRPADQTATAAVQAVEVPGEPALRILAGSTARHHVDRIGRIWTGDRYYTGGEVFTPSQSALLRAEPSDFCRQARIGDFEYDIPLKLRTYELHLYFVEMQSGRGSQEGYEADRIFTVAANGLPLLEGFDVSADVGGMGIVDERVFTDVGPASDGLLHLSFKPEAGKAVLNALELLPGTPGKMQPVRIAARSSPYLSSDQRLWEPDQFFHGGRTAVRTHPVEKSADPELYQGERYGNFSYAIPAAPGRYRVVLKFAETYFGPSNSSGLGPERRLFDVDCNGQTLLKEFNIARHAGGSDRPVDMVFHGLQPNAQGKIVLSFVPISNYACVNAIEVVPE